MEQDNFLWLQQWYLAHCNADWEHGSGIHIGTIDNPGWSLKVNLQDTELENKQFETVDIEKDKNNWYYCRVKEGKFEGAGGPLNLGDLLTIFKSWAEGTLI